jgi:cytochrome b pre-mRNA-processing protein 6
MANTLQNLPKHYARLLRLWPQDQLRNVTFQRATLQRLSPSAAPSTTATTTPTPIPSASQPTGPLTLAPHIIKSGSIPAPDTSTGTSGTLGAASETAQINALYSLLENRYSKMYPTSPEMLRPQSRPEYYEELAREMEEAPNRSWWQRKWMRIAGIVRFS